MFKNESDFKKLINRLDIDDKPDASHRENLRQQMLSVFKESVQQKPKIILLQSVWRTIMKSRITKFAAAAVIAVAVLLPLSYGATKLIKRFIAISQLPAIKYDGWGGALSPDGKHFAGVTWRGQLVVIDTSTGEKRKLTENCGGTVVWSDDGSEIAVQCKNTLLAVSAKTGKTRSLMEDSHLLQLEDWSPDGKFISGVTTKVGVNSAVLVNLENKKETVLAEQKGGSLFTHFSPKGDLVSYVTKEGDRYILHLQKIDGTSHAKYMDFPGGISQPLWSPDGSYIVFKGTQKGVDREYKDLWALRVQDNQFVGAPFPVVPDVGQMEFCNWSQNGQLAYQTGFSLGGIFTLPVDLQTGKATGSPRQLVRARGWKMYCWSPDGKQIAVHVGQGKLTFLSASTGEQIREVSLPEGIETNKRISWSPDGKWIVLSGWDKENKNGVFLITVETGEAKLLVPLEGPIAFSPTWSPDSKTIAYGYKGDVYVANIEDAKPRRITAPQEKREYKEAGRPVFAPDGKSVAYMAGGGRVLATTIDGKETREIFHLKNEKLIINVFDWSPDGRHIVFTPANNEIWCAPTDGGEPFRIADTSNLGQNSWLPRWSPTGEAIVFNVYHEKYQYWVMENFLSVE